MRILLVSIFAATLLHAQSAVQKIENVCAAEDAEALGLDCNEDRPCPVYLELASAGGVESSVFLAGNLHTSDTTLYGLLLSSSDGGKTWTEPMKRIRGAALQQIQFVDAAHGWISGALLDPLPRDPFLLSTVNGGDQWRKVAILSAQEFGSIVQFWFDTDTRGQLVLDRSQGKAGKYELLTTSSGGESWSQKSSSEQEIHLPAGKPADFRVTPGPDAYQVERRTGSGWEALATFPTRAGECK